MDEFKGLKVPGEVAAPDSPISERQEWYCNGRIPFCGEIDSCDDCLFYYTNIDKFELWYKEKQ